MSPASRSRRRAASSNRWRSASASTSGAMAASAVSARPSISSCSAVTAGAYSSGVCMPGARGPAAVQLVQRARRAGRAAGRDALRARAQRHRVEQGLHRGHRRPPAAERPERSVPRGGDHGQPGERLGRRGDPPGPVRAPGAAVVRRLMGRDEPQLAHRRLQRVRADHGVHPLGEREHVPDPAPPLPGGEVAAHPPAQVAAGADVEDLVAGAAEQVDPGGGGHRVGEHPLAAHGRRRAVRGGLSRAMASSSSRLCTPRLPTRSSSRCSTSTVHRASANARWVGRVAVPNSRASAPSRTLAASSTGSTARASRAVQSTGGRGQACPCRAQAARRNPVSNGALCATSTAPRRNSRTDGSTAGSRGAPTTMAEVMPVSATMLGGSPVPGSTSVASSPSSSPPRTLTAPISVIASVFAEPPVVSRSSTTKVTVRSGVPSSSNESWGGRGAGTARTLADGVRQNPAVAPAPPRRIRGCTIGSVLGAARVARIT